MRAARKNWWAVPTIQFASLIGLGLLVLLACAAPREAPRSAPAAPQAAAPAGSGGAPAAAAPGGGSAPAAPASTAGGAGGLPPIPAAIAIPAGAPTMLKVGMNIGASDAGFFLAMDKGYFAEQGIDIDILRGSGPEFVPPLATGEMDVIGPAVSAALLNAMARDIPMRIVADKGSDPPGFSYQVMALRKDLWDSGQVRDWGDLRGRRLAAASSISSVHYLFSLGLNSAGLTLADVESLAMPYPDMNAAFANGQIDMASFWEPLLTVGIENGWVYRWKPVDEFDPGHQSGILIYGKNFLVDKPDLGYRFMKAYMQAVRVYNDAYRKQVGRDEVNAIISKHTNVRVDLVDRMVPAGLNPDGCPNVENLTKQVAWFRREGHLQRDLEMDFVVDTRFCERATQELGRYSY
jgi:ABC-type nitrate/sulfonate/bicarbonate transport system substrate-binding protein